MPTTVALHQLESLSNEDSKNEILLSTSVNTMLHITTKEGETIISFPFGNKFDIINGEIIVHSK